MNEGSEEIVGRVMLAPALVLFRPVGRLWRDFVKFNPKFGRDLVFSNQ